MNAISRPRALAVISLLLATGVPSASADDFTTVINLPQDQAELSGFLLSSNTQVNVNSGGRIVATTWFGWPDGAGTTSENIEVNLVGGLMENEVVVNPGSRLNVFSGTITRSVQIRQRSSFVMSGGTLGDSPYFGFGSVVRMNGGSWGNSVLAESNDMRLTGGQIGNAMNVSSAGLELDGARVGRDMRANAGSLIKVMSGSFGSTTIFDQGRIQWTGGRGGAVDVRAGGNLTLSGGEFRLNGQPVSGMPAGLGPQDVFTGTLADGSVVVFSPLAGSFGVPPGDTIAPGTLTLIEVPLPAPVAHAVVAAGTTPPGGLRPGTSLALEAGGALPEYFSANGASITQNGGSIGAGLEMHDSVLNSSSGTIGGEIRLQGDSRLFVRGGSVGSDILIAPSARMMVESGTAGDRIVVMQGAWMGVSGGNAGDVHVNGGDLEITGGTVGNVQSGGGRVRMLQGGLGRLLALDGAEVAVAGGQIGDNLNALNSKITLGGGTIGSRGSIGSGSHVVVDGATLGSEWVVDGGSTLVLHDGSIGADLTIYGGCKLHITGGTVGGRLSSGAEMVVSGGVLQSPLYIASGSLNLRGTAFFLDGVDLTPTLVAGVPFTIAQRNVTLSGTLQDGTPFSIPLREGPEDSDGDGFFEDFVDNLATLTVTLVPGAAAAIAAEMQAAGFSGTDTLPGATPFGDGVPSLLKYAFNLPPGQRGGTVMAPGGTAGLPSITFDQIDGRVRVLMEYLRRADGSLDYRPRKSTALAPGTWIGPAATRLITPAAPGWERVRLEEWINPADSPRNFYRVEVEIP